MADVKGLLVTQWVEELLIRDLKQSMEKIVKHQATLTVGDLTDLANSAGASSGEANEPAPGTSGRPVLLIGPIY